MHILGCYLNEVWDHFWTYMKGFEKNLIFMELHETWNNVIIAKGFQKTNENKVLLSVKQRCNRVKKMGKQINLKMEIKAF